MKYDDLKAAELRALCEERGIKPSRAKADMIEDLKARDTADELTRLSQELDLPDEPMPERSPTFGKALEEPVEPAQDSPPPFTPEYIEKPAERPVVALTDVPWVEEGVFLVHFPRHEILDQGEHEANLQNVVTKALEDGFEPFGPPYRVHSRTQPNAWVYGVNIR